MLNDASMPTNVPCNWMKTTIWLGSIWVTSIGILKTRQTHWQRGKEAIRRFPTHELSRKLQRDFPMLLPRRP